ncbi:MAG: hypothetical protein B6242_10385 [Anaerolineaceae bacterium 4572_78]|nr:MAG: hypothetical protein B6242_10385 [Anaerolineaceae bacterium 4572_78]
MKFVNPQNDVAFKKIFGSEDKTQILISFLNAVLGLTGDKIIQEVTILNPFQAPRLKHLKYTTLDVRAKDKRGITFIVEMQVRGLEGGMKRFVYYAAKAYSSQLKRGEDYPKLNQVIFIGVLGYNEFEGKNYLSRHLILDAETHTHEIKDVEFNFIELPKFKKKKHELKTILEKWIYFIKHAKQLEVVPDNVEDEVLLLAYEVAKQHGWTDEELEVYDYWAMKAQDARGEVTWAVKKATEKARVKALAEGRAEGRAEERAETAGKMLAKGMDIFLIAELTGLTADEVMALS